MRVIFVGGRDKNGAHIVAEIFADRVEIPQGKFISQLAPGQNFCTYPLRTGAKEPVKNVTLFFDFVSFPSKGFSAILLPDDERDRREGCM